MNRAASSMKQILNDGKRRVRSWKMQKQTQRRSCKTQALGEVCRMQNQTIGTAIDGGSNNKVRYSTYSRLMQRKGDLLNERLAIDLGNTMPRMVCTQANREIAEKSMKMAIKK